ncbi:MAG: hypothetical protein ACI9EF_002427 [Pseudohongiellaceae bacterium]|jgi:hypothetical protein
MSQLGHAQSEMSRNEPARTDSVRDVPKYARDDMLRASCPEMRRSGKSPGQRHFGGSSEGCLDAVQQVEELAVEGFLPTGFFS